MQVITRVGYCEECAKMHYPQKGQLFLAVGSSNKLKVLQAEKGNDPGYTPHLYVIVKVNNGVVVYKTLCTINECGTYLVETEEGKVALRIDEDAFSELKTMTVAQWNALYHFTDSGFKI